MVDELENKVKFKTNTQNLMNNLVAKLICCAKNRDHHRRLPESIIHGLVFGGRFCLSALWVYCNRL